MQAPLSFSAGIDLNDDDLVEVGAYASVAEGDTRGLVVLAAGQPYWLVPDSGSFRLLVERGAADLARHHLAAFERESLRWPPPAVDSWTPRRFEWIGPLLWAVVVLAGFRLTERFPEWREVGALDPQALFHGGEGWRPFTALFLHGGPEHVIGNALSGLLVFPAVLATFGRWRGWMLVFLAAVIGNSAVAAIHLHDTYTSLGASTAIFAGVGLLTGRAIGVVAWARGRRRWRSMFAPLAAGLAVLALYGAGGQRVDVAAHLTGFLAGMLVGALAAARCLR